MVNDSHEADGANKGQIGVGVQEKLRFEMGVRGLPEDGLLSSRVGQGDKMR